MITLPLEEHVTAFQAGPYEILYYATGITRTTYLDKQMYTVTSSQMILRALVNLKIKSTLV